MTKRINPNNFIGKKFNKLKVVEYVGVIKGKSKFKCVCDCGNVIIVDLYKMKSSHTKSCGCLKNKIRNDKKFPRLYAIWRDMKYRCNNSHYKNYHRYGGRGIKVCNEWKSSFQAFKEWAFKNGYNDNLTIDRINNDLDYEPSNCRWATKVEQANNRTTNKNYEFNGEIHSIAEWSKIVGIAPKTIEFRLKANWDLKDVLCKPVDKKYSHKKGVKNNG